MLYEVITVIEELLNREGDRATLTEVLTEQNRSFSSGSASFANIALLKKPDVIYAIIVGGSNVAFYKQLKAAGIDLSKQTLLTISVTEDEIRRITSYNVCYTKLLRSAMPSLFRSPTARPFLSPEERATHSCITESSK